MPCLPGSASATWSRGLLPFAEKFNRLNSTMVPRREDIRAYVSRNAGWVAYQHLPRLTADQQ